jgi:hypothetical protein
MKTARKIFSRNGRRHGRGCERVLVGRVVVEEEGIEILAVLVILEGSIAGKNTHGYGVVC